MNLGKEIYSKGERNSLEIKRIKGEISKISPCDNVSAFQSELQKTATVVPKELTQLKLDLKEIQLIRNDRIFLSIVCPLLKVKFPEISFKSICMHKQERRGFLYLEYKGIVFLEFTLYKDHLSFKLTEPLIGQKIDFFQKLRFMKNIGYSNIKGLCNSNYPYYIKLNNELVLMSVQRLEYYYLTIENLFGFIQYTIDTAFSIFENSYYYKNKNTGELEFFISKLCDKKVYAKDMKITKNVLEDYYSSSDLKRGFSNFKRCFATQIPRIKKRNSREYEIA